MSQQGRIAQDQHNSGHRLTRGCPRHCQYHTRTALTVLHGKVAARSHWPVRSRTITPAEWSRKELSRRALVYQGGLQIQSCATADLLSHFVGEQARAKFPQHRWQSCGHTCAHRVDRQRNHQRGRQVDQLFALCDVQDIDEETRLIGIAATLSVRSRRLIRADGSYRPRIARTSTPISNRKRTSRPDATSTQRSPPTEERL